MPQKQPAQLQGWLTKVNKYPREEGSCVIIGPECFAWFDSDGIPYLSWRGQNFIPQPPRNGASARETLALGYVSAILASRAGAWKGKAPLWFPQPPEWLTLWEEALFATKNDR